MIFLVRHTSKLYRRYRHDIWGLCFLRMHSFYKSWLLRFFFRLYKEAETRKYERMRKYIYRIDVIKPRKKRRKLSERFLTLRLARLYFLTLKDYQFRALFKKASKLDGNLEHNYCLLLECRLLSLFYRTNFMSNIFEITQFVKRRNVLIDGVYTFTHLNAAVDIYSFISFCPTYKKRIRKNLYKRLRAKAILFNAPKFLFVSYFFFFACLCKMPSKRDLVYPVGVDLYRLTGYN